MMYSEKVVEKVSSVWEMIQLTSESGSHLGVMGVLFLASTLLVVYVVVARVVTTGWCWLNSPPASVFHVRLQKLVPYC